jgi:hypothetical protein
MAAARLTDQLTANLNLKATQDAGPNLKFTEPSFPSSQFFKWFFTP